MVCTQKVWTAEETKSVWMAEGTHSIGVAECTQSVAAAEGTQLVGKDGVHSIGEDGSVRSQWGRWNAHIWW